MLPTCSGTSRPKTSSSRTTANKLHKIIFREESHISLSWFHTGFPSWSNWSVGFWCQPSVFVQGGDQENPRKNLPNKTRINNNGTGLESNTAKLGGSTAQSLLSKTFGETWGIVGPSLLPKHTCSGIPTVHCWSSQCQSPATGCRSNRWHYRWQSCTSCTASEAGLVLFWFSVNLDTPSLSNQIAPRHLKITLKPYQNHKDNHIITIQLYCVYDLLRIK